MLFICTLFRTVDRVSNAVAFAGLQDGTQGFVCSCFAGLQGGTVVAFFRVGGSVPVCVKERVHDQISGSSFIRRAV
jgi:hypothetical protein